MSFPKRSASVYGGAGGRGAKVSVYTPEGLRNMLRNDRSQDALCIEYAVSRTNYNAALSLGDEKQTLRNLNGRLRSYVLLVRQLQEENQEVQKKIEHILAKRKAPKGRDWNQIQERLDGLENQIKNLTVENADLVLKIDEARLASEDFKNKKDEEVKAKKDLEKDLEKLKKNIHDTEMNRKQMQADAIRVKKNIEHLSLEHKNRVDDLLEKIKHSEVKVEVDSSNSNLADIINIIRAQYEKATKKNLQETEDWYKEMFENIKEKTDHNTKNRDAAKAEQQELLEKKTNLEIQISSGYNTFKALEEKFRRTKMEYSQKNGSLYEKIVVMKAKLKDLNDQVEHEKEKNEQLVYVTMKLEREIKTYKELLHEISVVTESARFELHDVLHKAQQRSNLHNEPKTDEEVKIPKAEIDGH